MKEEPDGNKRERRKVPCLFEKKKRSYEHMRTDSLKTINGINAPRLTEHEYRRTVGGMKITEYMGSDIVKGKCPSCGRPYVGQNGVITRCGNCGKLFSLTGYVNLYSPY